jgi:hypothetical protein
MAKRERGRGRQGNVGKRNGKTWGGKISVALPLRRHKRKEEICMHGCMHAGMVTSMLLQIVLFCLSIECQAYSRKVLGALLW